MVTKNDQFGNLIQVNDIVTLRCRVKTITDAQDGTNVELIALDGPEPRPEILCHASSLELLRGAKPYIDAKHNEKLEKEDAVPDPVA